MKMVRSTSMRTFATAFLLLMLVMASEIVPIMVAEARTCESRSKRFTGICRRDSICAAVCETEGFPGGECLRRPVIRRCICTRPCKSWELLELRPEA